MCLLCQRHCKVRSNPERTTHVQHYTVRSIYAVRGMILCIRPAVQRFKKSKIRGGFGRSTLYANTPVYPVPRSELVSYLKYLLSESRPAKVPAFVASVDACF
jgi:hypothetical protein